MDAALRLGGGHALHAVAAGFELERAVHMVTFDAQHDFLVAAELGREVGDVLTQHQLLGSAGREDSELHVALRLDGPRAVVQPAEFGCRPQHAGKLGLCGPLARCVKAAVLLDVRRQADTAVVFRPGLVPWPDGRLRRHVNHHLLDEFG